MSQIEDLIPTCNILKPKCAKISVSTKYNKYTITYVDVAGCIPRGSCDDDHIDILRAHYSFAQFHCNS